MSSGSSRDAKELVKQAIDIVELIGGFLSLRRQGRGYVALCPWHDDSRPSLQVNPERQSFKCWVCDIGGDVFSFIMKMENVAFPEALAMLADRAGVVLKPQHAAPGDQAAAAGDEKRTLYRAMAWAEQEYHHCLVRTPEAEPARRYLADRGIVPSNIERFHLGFAPDSWDWLLQRARSTPFTPKVLEAAGLVGRRQTGPGYYDRFKGRVLFSIRDTQSRPVGLGGRVLPGIATTNPAKYVNSPDTPLFSKSNLLYGLDLAAEAIRKSRVAVVMEGYTDCILAQQCGFENAVAVLGTALGERHIRLLRRFADQIVLVLDGDEAGQRRTNEILELFVAEQVDLRILTLPDGLDPCDFLLQRGAEEFRERLSNPSDALEHKFQTVTGKLGPNAGLHESNQALEEMLATLAKAPRLQATTTTAARLREHQILSRLARQFHVSEEELRLRMTSLRRSSGGRKRAAPATGATELAAERAIDPWERELVETLCRRPEAWLEASRSIQPNQLASPRCRQIFQKGCELAATGVVPVFERLLLEFDDPAIQSFLIELDEQGVKKDAASLAQRLGDLLRSFREREEDKQRRVVTVALNEGQVGEQQGKELLDQIIKQQRCRQGLSAPTDG
ncbi:MAG: DNA primase [Pirellulales bacterium]